MADFSHTVPFTSRVTQAPPLRATLIDCGPGVAACLPCEAHQMAFYRHGMPKSK